MFVISSHALAREVLRYPEVGLCISTFAVAVTAYPDRPAGTHFDSAMLVRALLQEAGEPFIVWPGRGQYPLTLGDVGWSSEDEKDLRVRLANRLLAAPDRRLVLPEMAAYPRRPSYIETLRFNKDNQNDR